MRVEFPAVGEYHGDFLRLADDMEIRHDDAVRPYDHARAEGILDLPAVPTERKSVSEEPLEERVAGEWRDRPPVDDLTRMDAHDGRRRLVDERSEEHTSELQSLMRISYAVFCLQKKNINK